MMMRLFSVGIEANSRIGRIASAVLLMALVVWISCEVPERAFATYADFDVDNAAAQEIGTYGDPIYASDIPDGVYEVDARTSSYMCIFYRTHDDASNKVSKEKCYIQVGDGQITAYFYISNMYTRLCFDATAEEAASLTNEDGSDDSPYLVGDPPDGYVPHYFSMDIPALNYPIKFAAFAGGNYSYSDDPKSSWYTRAKWYSRTVVFMPNKNTLAAIEEAQKSDSGSQDEKDNPSEEPSSSSSSASSSGSDDSQDGGLQDGGSGSDSQGGSTGGGSDASSGEDGGSDDLQDEGSQDGGSGSESASEGDDGASQDGAPEGETDSGGQDNSVGDSDDSGSATENGESNGGESLSSDKGGDDGSDGSEKQDGADSQESGGNGTGGDGVDGRSQSSDGSGDDGDEGERESGVRGTDGNGNAGEDGNSSDDRHGDSPGGVAGTRSTTGNAPGGQGGDRGGNGNADQPAGEVDDAGNGSNGASGSGQQGDVGASAGEANQGLGDPAGQASGSAASGVAANGAVRGVAIKPAALKLPDLAEQRHDQAVVQDGADDPGLSFPQVIALLFAGLVISGLFAQVVSFALARGRRAPRAS